jgi:hypothetical protein
MGMNSENDGSGSLHDDGKDFRYSFMVSSLHTFYIAGIHQKPPLPGTVILCGGNR